MADRSQFNPEQVERLLRPIKPNRVFKTEGQSNVAGWDIRAHLTRMFGFGGWEKEVLSLDLVSEVPLEKNGRTGWTVTYRCVMQLRVYSGGVLAWQNEDVATGSAQNQPQLGAAHDLAAKNAVTYALKRCAIDLGDQFGLSLYDKGRTGACVGMTLIAGTNTIEPDHVVDSDDHDPDQGLASSDAGVDADGVEPGGTDDVKGELLGEPMLAGHEGEPGGSNAPAGPPTEAEKVAERARRLAAEHPPIEHTPRKDIDQ